MNAVFGPGDAILNSPDGNKETFGSFLRNVIGVQLFLGLVGCVLFFITVGRPTNVVDLVLTPKVKAAVDPTTNSEKFMKEINQMEPLVLLAKGKKDLAAKAMKKLLTDKPDEVRTLVCAGEYYYHLGDNNKGYEYVDKSVAAAPDSKYILLNRARHISLEGKDAEALEAYEALVKRFPEPWAGPHEELAKMYQRQHNADGMVKEYKAVLDAFSTDEVKASGDERLVARGADIRKRLGMALCAQGDPKGGFEEFVKGFTIEKDSQGYPESVRTVVERNGGLVEGAINEERGLIEKDPNDLNARLMLARLQLSLSRYFDAETQLNEVMKKNEGLAELHEIKAELLFRQAQNEEDKAKAMGEFEMASRLMMAN